MLHFHEQSDERDRATASLRAALEEISGLPVDVTTSRTIAMAIGILMERYNIAPEEGFDLVVAVGQQQHRRVCDVASDLAVGGEPEAQWAAPEFGVA